MARGLAPAALLGACLLAPGVSAREPVHPDLGPVRFEDPAQPKALWVGLDVGGAVVPRRLGWYENRVWTARATPAWALSLAPGLSIGGRHGMSLYDVTGRSTAVRLRLHEHQLELSLGLLSRRADVEARDRLFVGVQTHAVAEMKVDGVEVRPGGVRDTNLDVGYGMVHPFGALRRWSAGWRLSGRYTWVFRDTQRIGMAAARLSFQPKPQHALRAEAQALLVHRDPIGAKRVSHGRLSAHGVFTGQYSWMSIAGVGPFVRGEFATHFASGMTPVFETRAAAVDAVFGELTVGLRAHW